MFSLPLFSQNTAIYTWGSLNHVRAVCGGKIVLQNIIFNNWLMICKLLLVCRGLAFIVYILQMYCKNKWEKAMPMAKLYNGIFARHLLICVWPPALISQPLAGWRIGALGPWLVTGTSWRRPTAFRIWWTTWKCKYSSLRIFMQVIRSQRRPSSGCLGSNCDRSHLIIYILCIYILTA